MLPWPQPAVTSATSPSLPVLIPQAWGVGGAMMNEGWAALLKQMPAPHLLDLQRSDKHFGVRCGFGQSWNEMPVSLQSLSLGILIKRQRDASKSPDLDIRPQQRCSPPRVCWLIIRSQAFRPRRNCCGFRTVF